MNALADLATELVRDPASAAGGARQVAATARAAGDRATESRAEVIRGRAMLLLGEIGLAEQALGAAIEAATAVGDDELAAEALLALGAVHSAAGRHDAAFGVLDEAVRLGRPELARRAGMQRAVVCRDAGRHDEALALFRTAEAELRRVAGEAPGALDLARVLANCGGILMQQGRIDEAVADLAEAIALLRDAGHEFVALQVTHDLGCAEAYRGNLPDALRLLDEAAHGMAGLGHDASFPLLSRAEALLRAGLTADAAAAAAEAARRLDAEGHADAALALITAAEASRLDGDPIGSLRFLASALDGRGADAPTAWGLAARLERARAVHELGESTEASLNELERLADAAATAGDLRAEVEARSLHVVVAAELGLLDRGARQLEAAGRGARRSGLAQLDALVGVAEAHLAIARDDLGTARRALRRSLGAVGATKEMYGGGESNPALGTEGRAAADATMRLAARETAARDRLAWTEHVRRLLRPTGRAVDRSVNFAALRANAAELRQAELNDEPTDALRRRQAELESGIRAQWLLERADSPRRASTRQLDALHRSVGDHTVVSIGFARGATIAVVVERRGTRSVDLEPPSALITLAERAAATLRGLSVASAPAVAEARRRACATAIAGLEARILAPLRIRSDDVVLVVPPPLLAAPWAATETLRHRRFTFAPSVTWWLDAVEADPPTGTAALVVAGPRLGHASEEAVGVAACHAGTTLLDGDRASVAPVLDALGSHDIAHVVAHGRFRRDNPLWSTIELADGPMSVYELQQLDRVPHTVVLATCESGAAGGHVGAELQGVAATLLDLGARSVVASVGPLPDDAVTRDAMVALHRDLAAGIGPAASLARRRNAGDAATVDATTAALITIGVGG